MIWHSPHGTTWEAETYEEALEMERDALVQIIRNYVVASARALPNRDESEIDRATEALVAVVIPPVASSQESRSDAD